MSDYIGVVVLALLTFGAVMMFALANKAAVENRMESDTPKSTLAADKSSKGKPVDV